MSEVETPRLTEERIAEIKARAEKARAARESMNGATFDPSDLNALDKIDAAIGSLLRSQQDLPALLTEVERQREQLQLAVGALADIGGMTGKEVAQDAPRRKARRIYQELEGEGQ